MRIPHLAPPTPAGDAVPAEEAAAATLAALEAERAMAPEQFRAAAAAGDGDAMVLQCARRWRRPTWGAGPRRGGRPAARLRPA